MAIDGTFRHESLERPAGMPRVARRGILKRADRPGHERPATIGAGGLPMADVSRLNIRLGSVISDPSLRD